MIYQSLSGEAAKFVTNLFQIYQVQEMVYHNLDHTKSVVQKCEQITAFYELSATEIFITAMAAWFHDTGHLLGSEHDHEERSSLIMREFFANKQIDQVVIDSIAHCILATKLPAKPITTLEKILCDADLFHLGTAEFSHLNELVKQEYEWRNKVEIKDWEKGTLTFMKQHEYFTDYCKTLLNEGKEKNMKSLDLQ